MGPDDISASARGEVTQGPQFESAVRREAHRDVAVVGARYLPALAAAVTLVLLVVLVPDKPAASPSTVSSGTPAGTNSAQPGTDGTPTVAGPGTTPGSAAAAATGPSSATPATGPSGATPATGQGGQQPTGATTLHCGYGVAHLAWSPYAPGCSGSWSGSNGGVTAHGVTAQTVTVVMRDTSDLDSFYKAEGIPSFTSQVHDMSVFIQYFNKQFQLYSRQVVLKTFNGSGSYAAEAGNQDQAGASADAQSAYDLGSFAEIDTAVGTYADALSSHHLIDFTINNSANAFRNDQPYRYGSPEWPLAENVGVSFAALTCQQMAHRPAVYAGDATYQRTTRKFAVVEPEQSEFAGAAATYLAEAKSCGVNVEEFQYNLDFSTESLQAAQIARQLKADGITTIMMAGDPLMSSLLTNSANSQLYDPEWVFNYLSDSVGRMGNASEMAHAMQVSPWHANTAPPSQSMCYHIYQLADPHGTPQSGSQLNIVCANALEFFAALQQAGPSLNAATFERGWFSLPPSAGSGDFGGWSYGNGQWASDATFNLEYWRPNVTSPYDGGGGQFLPCNSGLDYFYAKPEMTSGQPQCFAG